MSAQNESWKGEAMRFYWLVTTLPCPLLWHGQCFLFGFFYKFVTFNKILRVDYTVCQMEDGTIRPFEKSKWWSAHFRPIWGVIQFYIICIFLFFDRKIRWLVTLNPVTQHVQKICDIRDWSSSPPPRVKLIPKLGYLVSLGFHSNGIYHHIIRIKQIHLLWDLAVYKSPFLEKTLQLVAESVSLCKISLGFRQVVRSEKVLGLDNTSLLSGTNCIYDTIKGYSRKKELQVDGRQVWEW